MSWSTRVSASCLVALAALVGACNWVKPATPAADERSAKAKLVMAKRLKRACGSAETYDRLKALTFDEVSKVRSAGSGNLEPLFAAATLRMEEPIAKSRDEALDITVCEGHMVLDLPPGVADAFNGKRQLEADVEYSAQQAADGSGLVYAMKGAEPIVYRLAALTLPGGTGGAARPSVTVAAAPPPPVVLVPPTVTEPKPLPRVVRPVEPSPPTPPPRPVPAPAPRLEAEAPRAVGTARPSFSCARVTGRVLRQICSDPDLAARDRRMSSVFYAALASGDGQVRAALSSSRTRFLQFRDRCPTAACVAQAYDDRIAEIRDIAAR